MSLATLMLLAAKIATALGDDVRLFGRPITTTNRSSR